LEPADAVRDAESFDLELILADIEIVERRLERAKKNAKGGDKKYKREMEMCEALIAHLEEEKPARDFPFTEEDKDILVDGGLLSVKPVIYVANLDEDGMSHYAEDANFQALTKFAQAKGAAVLPVAAKFEEDIAELDPEEAQVFMEDMGLTETGLDRLIRTSYDLLGYISFLTAGEDDVHAWTIVKGTKAPRAAGKIHTDIERGFIRAEIVAFEDLKACGSMAAVKEKGLFRLEGKDYVMQDGDVTMFRFNV
jgi:GTP-binding protein YchF